MNLDCTVGSRFTKMDIEDSYNTNLYTVKEMLLDEEKLVSYITLSKDLCMHVNNSKQLLSRAVQKIREEQPNIQLNVSYIISGLSGSDAAITTICTENDLDKLRKSLCVVFFYHVYSVCKGSPNIDNAAFLLLNKYEDYSLCPGLIRSKECIKRTSDEIGHLKTNSQDAIVLENKPLIAVNNKLKQAPKNVSEVSKKAQVEETKVVKTEIKSETKIKVEAISPNKESNSKQSVQKKNDGVKAQKGIASFFNKSNGSQTSKVTNSLQKNKVSNGLENKKPPNGSVGSKLEVEKMDIDNEPIEIEIGIKKEMVRYKKETKPKDDKKVVKKEPAPDEKNKALNKVKKSSKVEKKRKRLLHVSDSESDEDNDPFVDKEETNNVNNESDDEIPPTPSANSIKITSGIVNPKKRRKVVDKTYTDEDGYILTKKEEVFESCSENEDEIKVEKALKTEKQVKKVENEVSPSKTKKNSPKKSKKKISPPQKGKQPTLNSFFNKK